MFYYLYKHVFISIGSGNIPIRTKAIDNKRMCVKPREVYTLLVSLYQNAHRISSVGTCALALKVSLPVERVCLRHSEWSALMKDCLRSVSEALASEFEDILKTMFHGL